MVSYQDLSIYIYRHKQSITIVAIFRKQLKVLRTILNQFSLKALTDSAIQLAVRPWAINEDFALCIRTLEDCKKCI
jgi:small conductance mechanosensitive channel